MHIKKMQVRKWVIAGLVIVNLLLSAHLGRAQGQEETSVCVDTTALKGNAKKLADAECKLKLAEIKRQTSLTEKLPTPVPVATDKIGSAKDNKAVITAVSRAEKRFDEAGGLVTSYEASKEGAKHEEEMAKIEVKLEKAKHPDIRCLNCGYGYNGYGGYSGYVAPISYSSLSRSAEVSEAPRTGDAPRTGNAPGVGAPPGRK